MPVKFRDYYQILGVARDASQDEIKRAHRKLARKYHPDVNKDKEASENFGKISEAYEVLKDPETRKRYDQLGENWKAGQDFTPPPGFENIRFEFGGAGGQGFSFSPNAHSDFFETLFGRGAQGGQAGFEEMLRGGNHRPRARSRATPTSEAALTITLEDAYHGATKQITLRDTATGAAKTYQVKIPPGTTNGSKIRLAGQGKGDVLLLITIATHPRFEVHGYNLHTTTAISPWEAALGAKIPAETLDGEVTLTLPPGSQSGQKLRLRGKGLPQRSHPGQRGDLLVHLKIVVPKTLSNKEKELFEALNKESTFDPRAT